MSKVATARDDAAPGRRYPNHLDCIALIVLHARS